MLASIRKNPLNLIWSILAIAALLFGINLTLQVSERLESVLWAVVTVIFIAVLSFALASGAKFLAAWRGWSGSEQRQIFWGVFFASPWLIGFVIFVLGPSVASLYYSFTKYKLGENPEWIGLQNYANLIAGIGASGRRFAQSMYNSFYYALIGVPLQILASLIMAVLLNTTLRGIKTFRLIFYMPVILAGGPAILLAWRYMLGSNGGFINLTLRNFADSFFLFDWIYRFFIYSTETFNGFYAGLTRGDPIGPMKYLIPAFLGFMILLWLVKGGWESYKQLTARRFAEVLSMLVGGILFAGALTVDPLPITLSIGIGLLFGSSLLINIRQDRPKLAFYTAIVGILLMALGALSTLFAAANLPVDENSQTIAYLLAIFVASLPLIYAFFGKWSGRKLSGLTLILLVLGIILFILFIPGQLDGGRLNIVFKYLTFQSGLEQIDNLDYLKVDFPENTLSALWLYASVVLVMVSLILLDSKRTEKIHRVVLYGSLLIFGILTISTFLDTLRYFNAYEAIAVTTETKNYHFSLFRQASAQFPDGNRVPLWMSSELWSKPSLILINMWSAGAGMLIFLAALKGVPQSLYEAAEVDGAGRIQKFFKITLPLISPALFYNVVIGMIAALQTFETVYILQNTQTQDSLASAAYYLYERTFRQLAIGEGSAMSWILALIIVAITIIQFRYSDWVHYEA